MKIVLAGLGHETNCYAPTATNVADFGRFPPGFAFPAGAAVRRAFEGTRTVPGGVLAAADRLGLHCEPLLRAFATPGGVVAQDAYQRLLDLLLARLEPHRDAAGIVLDLHGAMVAEQLHDAEGHLLGALREVVGPELPIVAVLDLHANISPAMARHADILIGYDHYPHTDMAERGEEAVALLARTVRGEVRPVQVHRPIPLLTMPPRQCTLDQPMRGLLERVWELEQRPGVLTITLAMGFPFSDVPDAGASVVVVTDDQPALADELADELAAAVWARRREFAVQLTPVEAVIRCARRPEPGLVLLADGSDNPGGGAPCDGTVVLEALIEADVADAVVAVIADPATASQAHDAGVGALIHTRLGGKTDTLHGPPLEVDARVRFLSDGEFTYQAEMGGGAHGSLGPTAVLAIGGVLVVVTSERTQVWDPEILRSVGLEPAEHRLLVLKSTVHYRAAFDPLTTHRFDADTPGVHRPDFGSYAFTHIRRPMFPLDPDTSLALPDGEHR